MLELTVDMLGIAEGGKKVVNLDQCAYSDHPSATQLTSQYCCFFLYMVQIVKWLLKVQQNSCYLLHKLLLFLHFECNYNSKIC
jgi:hypothetical protein